MNTPHPVRLITTMEQYKAALPSIRTAYDLIVMKIDGGHLVAMPAHDKSHEYKWGDLITAQSVTEHFDVTATEAFALVSVIINMIR